MFAVLIPEKKILTHFFMNRERERKKERERESEREREREREREAITAPKLKLMSK